MVEEDSEDDDEETLTEETWSFEASLPSAHPYKPALMKCRAICKAPTLFAASALFFEFLRDNDICVKELTYEFMAENIAKVKDEIHGWVVKS